MSVRRCTSLNNRRCCSGSEAAVAALLPDPTNDVPPLDPPVPSPLLPPMGTPSEYCRSHSFLFCNAFYIMSTYNLNNFS